MSRACIYKCGGGECVCVYTCVGGGEEGRWLAKRRYIKFTITH